MKNYKSTYDFYRGEDWKRDTKPTEFAEYNSYCEECKATAKRILKIN